MELLVLPALLCALASGAAERRETSITSVLPDRDGYWTLRRDLVAARAVDEMPPLTGAPQYARGAVPDAAAASRSANRTFAGREIPNRARNARNP